MQGKPINSKGGDDSAKAHKRGAAMLDIIALAAALLFLLAACATAIPEVNNASSASPAISDSPAASANTAVEVTVSPEPSPEMPYPEYVLTDRSAGAPLHLGIQTGAYPWAPALEDAFRTSHTSGDMPGTVFYRVDGNRFRLFYHHIEETGKDVVSTFMTTLDTYETARGIACGDTMEKLLEAYDDNLLHVPEPFPVSQDMGGDFCVYDELFVYTRPEDDNCCIVFYIAGNIDSKFITGLRISLGQDGGPEYFADGVNTFAVDYGSLEQYLKTDTGDEERVHELLDRLLHAQGPGKAGEGVTASDVLEAMTGMNWRIYGKRYTTDSYGIIDWLYGLEITAPNDILCVLKATKGLDGAYAEGYSGVLANIYRNDGREFIRLAAQLEPTQIDNIAQLICYDLCLDKDAVILQLEGYQKSGGLTEMEQCVASDILHYFELWYSDQ